MTLCNLTTTARWQNSGMANGLRVLLLHGLGATGAVWSGWEPILERHWPGRWAAPDLPGHGGSPELPGYTFDALAEAVRPLVDPGGGTVVLGHSLGGVVALALAAKVPLAGVAGLGIKVDWTGEELGRARALAGRPVTWFDSEDEAITRYLRVSGLAGLIEPGHPAARDGVREQDGRWRLALDPRAFGVGAPDMAALVAGSPSPLLLARGENDPMNTDDQIKALGVRVSTLPGLGHNAHVESPERCAELLRQPEFGPSLR
ncbi:pimeloyl-ACP methyl ester carboxylesterase [Actinoplanes italicus]|uniref:Pimeloyl-ACP methyl ester carboxylesterase n=2 Tax=Actinoplanes italicus TaxID=113567 RepID=A0A2T0KEZ7_9ACTN|nr:pimeloyl-ACP methyl ester carboxylesterase [Actinoplanes italicus]